MKVAKWVALNSDIKSQRPLDHPNHATLSDDKVSQKKKKKKKVWNISPSVVSLCQEVWPCLLCWEENVSVHLCIAEWKTFTLTMGVHKKLTSKIKLTALHKN